MLLALLAVFGSFIGSTNYGPEPHQVVDYVDVGSDATVVYLHAGSWAGGTRHEVPEFMGYFVEAGYNLASVEYGLTGDGYNYQDIHAEVLAAINALIKNGIGERFILAGASAGGEIAARVVASYHGRINIIGYFGVVPATNLEDLASQPAGIGPGAALAYLDGTDPAVGTFSSNISVVRLPPALAFYGGADPLVGPAHREQLESVWSGLGGDIEIVVVSERGHNLEAEHVPREVVLDWVATLDNQ